MSKNCPLCRKPGELVDSHIIPRLFWRKLKNNGQYEFFDGSSGKIRKDQSEHKEKLLCKECDTVVLREYEAHLAKLIYIEQEGTSAQAKHSLHLQGLPYHMLKRAILSIAWRMHHSSLPIFEKVCLTSAFEERIRQYLLKEIDLGAEEFPFLVASPLIDGKGATNFMLSPFQTKFKGKTPILNITLQGMIFSVLLHDNFFHPEIQDFLLKEDGSLVILKGDIMKFSLLREALEKFFPPEEFGYNQSEVSTPFARPSLTP